MSQENVEIVRRWYALVTDPQDVSPADDPAFADRAFRDFLDEARVAFPDVCGAQHRPPRESLRSYAQDQPTKQGGAMTNIKLKLIGVATTAAFLALPITEAAAFRHR